MKLYLDPGHGGQDPGAQGHGLNEKDLTLDIALKLQSILQNEYEEVEVKMSRTSDITKGLSQRTSEANSWGADYYLSIHINSAVSSAEGYEDYIYSGLSNSSTTAKYQNIIHGEDLRENELKDRGTKKANFLVLRESAMPAILTENGFITNTHDAALMKQSSWRQKVAQGHANGLAKAFKLKRKHSVPEHPPPPPAPVTLYKVFAGSFQSRKNADEQVASLHSKGFEAFVNSTTIFGETWYRVQTGAFESRNNADELLAQLKKAGYKDSFLVADTLFP
ncbi:N-acetylmuramoyl-L-alanine amidase [Neobacillus kokaensis]|uniref:Sporulation-specific N-acetylmuramoyl-L-alanine amidase n=1 Tax=Neobacillus kokaensis TaxID=2759023 RepID=A0ABQ3MXI6_9BACI|nr:N-acetylmuramoyl-L-alanine amidase [Neobacillus kokaensis]GHH97403.1 sporulation-specific N-acetylmuramoyl-L-alanine amidase [Neobacillus kokaensis]